MSGILDQNIESLFITTKIENIQMYIKIRINKFFIINTINAGF